MIAIARAEEIRVLSFMSDLHVTANADVAAESSEQRSAKKQVAGKARDESRVVRKRNERNVFAKARDGGVVRGDEQGKRQRRTNQTRHHAFAHPRAANEPP